MPMIHFQICKCPRCAKPYDLHILNLSSGLGPKAIRCAWCQATVQTDRREWPDTSLRGRLWFLASSVIYVVAFGAICANLGDQIYQLKSGVGSPANMRWEAPSFRAAALVTAGGVLVFQALRCLASRARRQAGEGAPYHLGKFNGNLLFALQMKCLAGALLAYGLALAWLRSGIGA